jgi:hypothetical protein
MAQEKVILEDKFIYSLKQHFGEGVKIRELQYRCGSNAMKPNFNNSDSNQRVLRVDEPAYQSFLEGMNMAGKGNENLRMMFVKDGQVFVRSNGEIDFFAANTVKSMLPMTVGEKPQEAELVSLLDKAILHCGSMNLHVEDINKGRSYYQPIVSLDLQDELTAQEKKEHKALDSIAYWHSYRVVRNPSINQLMTASRVFGTSSGDVSARLQRDPQRVLKAIKGIL